MSGEGLIGDSDMSTSVNSDASYDIDIVRHHDGKEDLQPHDICLKLDISSGHFNCQPAGRQGLRD